MMTTSGLKSLAESAEEEQINQDIRYVETYYAVMHVALACILWCRFLTQPPLGHLQPPQLQGAAPQAALLLAEADALHRHVLQQMGAQKYSIMCRVCDGALSVSTFQTLLVNADYLTHILLQPAALGAVVLLLCTATLWTLQ